MDLNIKDIILEQKHIAELVYKKLRMADPYCILAGGAPRDWYYGMVAKDLDFYFYSSGETIRSVEKQLSDLMGFEVKHSKYSQDKEAYQAYKTMPFLRRVFKSEVCGLSIDFVQLVSPNDQFKVVDHMDVSICKIWADGGLKLVPSKDFLLTDASKVMFLTEGYKWTDLHPKKVIDKFGKKFVCGTKESAKEALVRNGINERLKQVEDKLHSVTN